MLEKICELKIIIELYYKKEYNFSEQVPNDK